MSINAWKKREETIRFLVNQKFRLAHSRRIRGASYLQMTRTAREALDSEISAYEAELGAKADGDLEALKATEQQKIDRALALQERIAHLQRFPQPDWAYWRQIPSPKLWQLVALSCDVEPRKQQAPYSREGSILKTSFPLFSDRYEIALGNQDRFKPVNAPAEPGAWEIPAGQFLTFATRSEWHIPDQMQTMEPVDLAGTWDGFDPDSDSYPRELDIGLMAWRAVSQNPGKGSPKQQIAAWLRAHYSDLSGEAVERIATVCNWGKSGGKPSQRS